MPSQAGFPSPETEPGSPAFQMGSSPTELSGKLLPLLGGVPYSVLSMIISEMWIGNYVYSECWLSLSFTSCMFVGMCLHFVWRQRMWKWLGVAKWETNHNFLIPDTRKITPWKPDNMLNYVPNSKAGTWSIHFIVTILSYMLTCLMLHLMAPTESSTLDILRQWVGRQS